MSVYKAPGGSPWSGRTVGILVLDEQIPRVPGSVGNAETFGYPVRYRMVEGATVERLLYRMDLSMKGKFIESAQTLVKEGADAIVGSCGFMALFQNDLREAVEVPVLLSSLVQLPFIASSISTDRKIGVITASAESLRPQLLAAAGIDIDFSRLRVYGLGEKAEARRALLDESGVLNESLLRAEVLETAQAMTDEHNDIGAVLMECSELPPYSADVQLLVRKPVFDFITMIDYLHASLKQRAYPAA